MSSSPPTVEIEPFYDDGRATIYRGDALEVLGQLNAGYDLAVLDLPYNVGKDYGPGCTDDLEPSAYRAWVIEMLRAVHDVAETLVWFPGTVNVPGCYDWLAQTDWRFERQLGWHKKEYAGDLFAGGPAMCWESIIWATNRESERRWNKVFGAWGRDFLIVNATHGDPLRAHHPCPKPPEVLRRGSFVGQGRICARCRSAVLSDDQRKASAGAIGPDGTAAS